MKPPSFGQSRKLIRLFITIWATIGLLLITIIIIGNLTGLWTISGSIAVDELGVCKAVSAYQPELVLDVNSSEVYVCGTLASETPRFVYLSWYDDNNKRIYNRGYRLQPGIFHILLPKNNDSDSYMPGMYQIEIRSGKIPLARTEFSIVELE